MIIRRDLTIHIIDSSNVSYSLGNFAVILPDYESLLGPLYSGVTSRNILDSNIEKSYSCITLVQAAQW